MKISQFTYWALIFMALVNGAMAEPDRGSSLSAAREQVVRRYLLDLQKADYKDIAELFEKEGVVISTSRGKANAKDFFYAFLPMVTKANTELHQLFVGSSDVNRDAVRFHLDFQLKDGEIGKGEYVDEFVFTDNSAKIAALYMFENLKFENT